MWALIITMSATVGIQDPIILSGPPDYTSYGECAAYGERVVDWLRQDMMKVVYDCRPIEQKEGQHDEETKILDPTPHTGVH